jgi:hypothetical protein
MNDWLIIVLRPVISISVIIRTGKCLPISKIDADMREDTDNQQHGLWCHYNPKNDIWRHYNPKNDIWRHYNHKKCWLAMIKKRHLMPLQSEKRPLTPFMPSQFYDSWCSNHRASQWVPIYEGRSYIIICKEIFLKISKEYAHCSRLTNSTSYTSCVKCRFSDCNGVKGRFSDCSGIKCLFSVYQL